MQSEVHENSWLLSKIIKVQNYCLKFCLYKIIEKYAFYNPDLCTAFALSYKIIFCMLLELSFVNRGLLSVLACMAMAHLTYVYAFCIGLLLFYDDGEVWSLYLYAGDHFFLSSACYYLLSLFSSYIFQSHYVNKRNIVTCHYFWKEN